eukprot:582973-Pyramimonas_sp.AAC.1
MFFSSGDSRAGDPGHDALEAGDKSISFSDSFFFSDRFGGFGGPSASSAGAPALAGAAGPPWPLREDLPGAGFLLGM